MSCAVRLWSSSHDPIRADTTALLPSGRRCVSESADSSSFSKLCPGAPLDQKGNEVAHPTVGEPCICLCDRGSDLVFGYVREPAYETLAPLVDRRRLAAEACRG